ncbi:MAG: dTMP kinase [Verrucomicrobiota bacterium]
MAECGKFITFEGTEGCGKSTQIAALRNQLADHGIDSLLTREPGGTDVGEKIRDLLQYAPEGEGMTSESELLLFTASRAQLVREVIAPALEEGKWVIADRFFDSTTIYQGIGRGLDLEAVKTINRFAVGGCYPEITILLDIDAKLGHQRATSASGAKRDRMESQPPEFYEAVRSGYLDLAKEEPDRFSVIEADQPIDKVSKEIWKVCQPLLNQESDE